MNAKELHSFNDGSLTGVFLSNGFESKEDPDYGICTSYHELLKLTNQVCVALALRTGRLRGVEFQYIRKAMELPRTEVARMFGRTELTIINWESKNKVPLEASLLIKQNCLRKFGYAKFIEKILDQQGQNGFSDEPITMRFDPSSKLWESNLHPLHPLQPWATIDSSKPILTVMENAKAKKTTAHYRGKSRSYKNPLINAVDYVVSAHPSEEEIRRWDMPRKSIPAFMIDQIK